MPINSLKPLAPDEFDYWKANHLLNRAGFGGTPGQVRALANMGLNDAVDYVVEFQDIEQPLVQPDAFKSDVMRPPTMDEQRELRRARQSGDEKALEAFRQARQRRQREDRQQMSAFQRWWLTRMIETPRPLEEKLTLFWHGHFATSYRAIEDSYHMFVQNQLFRTNAAGNFRKLVHGIVHDPAMLRYLNNNQNRRENPNENLARELMELFTLGEGNGYSEDDIKEGARALTGYTYNDDSFVFRERAHDRYPKTILGKRGNWDGDDLVEIIFTQRYVSEHMCQKLYKFFVNDVPGGPDKATQSFIQKLAKKFRGEQYELRPVLKTLFRSQHFYDPVNMAAQIKSPIQLSVQTVRTLRTPVRSLNTLLGASAMMGQNLGYPPSVKGWDGGRSWINTATLFVRQNLVLYLLTGQRPGAYPWQADGTPYDARPLLSDLEATGEPIDTRAALAYLLRFTLGREPHAQRVETLAAYVDERGGTRDNDTLVGVLSLIAAMPEYQLC
jgi:uncharacterized protein (DUF1800 family)